MSEMINRVAKAISDYWLEHGFDPSEPNDDVARAALEAMRTPTEAVLSAGMAVKAYDGLEEMDSYGSPQDVWQAMIDAALSEKP